MRKSRPRLVSLINVYVPPLLEYALGCTGAGRYIAYWVHPRDGLCWTDGSHADCGQGLDVWTDYVRDPRVAPYLVSYEMGSEDRLARDWIVLDRQERRFSVGAIDAAASFMRDHRAPVSIGRLKRSRRGRR